MPGAGQPSNTSSNASKSTDPNKNGDLSSSSSSNPAQDTNNTKKAATQLEEDDEFEDFPVEDWTEEETQIPGGNAHLWEESWDDDDTNEDFAVQLR